MTEYLDGWFKVSRRLFDSSRWFKEDPKTLKLLFFLIGEAQNPVNPEPGTVRISDPGLASRTGLDRAWITDSIDRLCEEDPDSRSTEETGGSKRTLERVPGGVRLVNFDLYQPGMVDSALVKAAWRHERAKKAADARWAKLRAAQEAPKVSPESTDEDEGPF